MHNVPCADVLDSEQCNLKITRFVVPTMLNPQFPMSKLVFGVALHPHLSHEPEAPFAENWDRIRSTAKLRAAVLSNAAENEGTAVSEEAAAALRAKAKSHLKDMKELEDEALFRQTTLRDVLTTLDVVDTRLKQTMQFDPDDECEGWLLGSLGMTAVDISLGVILNQASLLGLRHLFWAGTTGGERPRPFLRKFFKQIRQRPSFVKSLTFLGKLDDTTDAGKLSPVAGGPMEPSQDSLEILEAIVEGKRQSQADEPLEKTWRDLW